MSVQLRMWDLTASPNSKKVRLALGYKGIDYERIPVDPSNRKPLVEVSGQPLTPVIQHGSTVIFDSSAILRYLEANVQREPRLFSGDYDAMKTIEGWEAFARTELGPPVRALYMQARVGSEADPGVIRTAVAGFHEAVDALSTGLTQGGFLTGDSPTAGDLACAAVIALSMVTPEQAKQSPFAAFFAEHLRLSPERGDVAEWFGAINRHDGAVA